MKKLLLLIISTIFAVAVITVTGCSEEIESEIKPPNSSNPSESNPSVSPGTPDETATYKITFTAQEQIVSVLEYSKGDTVNEPEVPYLFGYTGEWEKYEIAEADITVKAIYTPIVYNVTYHINNQTVNIQCTVEDDPDIPEIPEIKGYNGVWKYFVDGNNITANIVYTPINYFTDIFIDGKYFETIYVNIENIYSNLPIIPEREHYTAEWSAIEYSDNRAAINATYSAVNYYIKFFVDGQIVAEIPYTVENDKIEEPTLPVKEHYDGKWENYTLSGGNLEVNAVYTPTKYKIQFFIDEELVETLYYTVEDKYVIEPKLPHITGYMESWEDYSLDGGDIAVNAVYLPLPQGTDGLVYSLTDGGYAVCDYTGSEPCVLIPPYYNDVPVTAVANEAFSDCAITQITFSDGITKIGKRAFYYCENLCKVNLPNSLTELGKEAFFGCSSLESIQLPNRITELKEQTFTRSGLKNITLPSDLLVICKTAFYCCTGLTQIYIPDKVTTICTYAFAGCTNLENVYIGKNVNEIEMEAFLYCDKLSHVEFGNTEGWFVNNGEDIEHEKDVSEQFSASPEAAAMALLAYSTKYIFKK